MWFFLAFPCEVFYQLILLVNQIHHYLHHHILFLGTALCNHQRQGHEGVVGYALASVGTIEDMVVVEEPKEERGGNAFITVAERVVLRDEIEQHGGFLLHTWVEFLASKGLIDLSDAAFEGLVFLVAKKSATAELLS